MKTAESNITEKVNVWEELSRVKKLEEPINTLQEVLENIVIEKPKKVDSKYTKLIFLHYKHYDLEIIYEIMYKGRKMYINKFFPNDLINEGRITNFEIKNGVCYINTPISNMTFNDLFKSDDSNALWNSKDHNNFALLKAFSITQN